MAVHKLSILVEALGTAQADRKLKGIDRTISRIGSRAGQGIRTAADNLARLGVIGAGVAAAGLVASVKAAADFESQLHTINTVAQATPERLDAIGKGIRQIARDTGTPLAELTQGFYDLVSAGIAADQAQRVLASSNRLAIGGLASAAEGVDLLTTALNAYGVSARDQGKESERFADIFAKSIEKGKVTAAELAASFATVGPIAAKSGIEIEELAAGYATLTAQGVPAAEAATQMRSAIVGLLSPNAKLNAIQKKTGVNFAELAKKKGLVPALERLRVEAKKAGVPLIDLVGRVEGFNFAISATGDNLAGYNANLDDMRESSGTAARQMSERQQGLNFQLARLKALALDAGITIGSKLLPKLTPLVEKAVAFLDTHQADLDRFGDAIAGSFDKAASFAARIPWEAVGSGLKTAAEWSGRLLDLFTSMPPGVQSTIIALAGLNKLSGGAITGIVGELGKGLIKGVLGINAGVVNVNAGVVRGPGSPAPGGGPPAGQPGPGGEPAPGPKPGVVVPAIGAAVAGLTVEDVLRENERFLADVERLRGGVTQSVPERRRTRPLEGSSGFNAKFVAPALRTERAAIGRFAGSTAPSMKSMEAHLARLRELQARVPTEDRMNTNLIVTAIADLKAAIAAWRPQVAVTVGVPARTVARSTVVYRRAANSGRVGID